MKFYTAIGRFEMRYSETGERYPLVMLGRQECLLDPRELMLWSAMTWRILSQEQAEQCYQTRMESAVISEGMGCGHYLKRLMQRGLISCGEAESDEDALYELVCELHVIPRKRSMLKKIVMFMTMLYRHIPFKEAKAVFAKERLTPEQEQILKLTQRVELSIPEVIQCIEMGAKALSSDIDVMDALYHEPYTNSANMVFTAKYARCRREVVMALSDLYLRQLISFGRL